MLVHLVFVPAILLGQIQSKKVSFPTGKSNTIVSGTIKGETTVDYVVSTKAGQELSAHLTSKNSSLYFNVLPPGSNDVAMFIGSTEGNKFTRTLSASGDYKIRVFLYRNAARRNESAKYELSIGLIGARQ